MDLDLLVFHYTEFQLLWNNVIWYKHISTNDRITVKLNELIMFDELPNAAKDGAWVVGSASTSTYFGKRKSN